MKKETRQRKELRLECDNLWSKFIFKLYRGKCARCGAENVGMDSHHILSRSRYPNLFIKYNILNGLCLCSMPKKDGEISCHTYCDQNQDEIIDWLKTNLPQHYAFAKGVQGKDDLPKKTLTEIRSELLRAHNVYDIKPLPQIIPRCNLPPYMLEALIAKQSGIVLSKNPVRPAGDVRLK